MQVNLSHLWTRPQTSPAIAERGAKSFAAQAEPGRSFLEEKGPGMGFQQTAQKLQCPGTFAVLTGTSQWERKRRL